jgi:LPS sulfotransferase NodH
MPGLLILAKQRTGTNWLRSLLAGASTLQDLDEVFHTDSTIVPHGFFPWYQQAIGPDLPLLRDPPWLCETFGRYLDWLTARFPVPMIDIKYNSAFALAPAWQSFADPPWPILVASQRGFVPVHLLRRNRAAQALSQIVADGTRRHVVRAEAAPPAPTPLPIDLAEMRRIIAGYRREAPVAASWLQGLPGARTLVYEQLATATPHGRQRVLRALATAAGAAFHGARPAGTQRIITDWRAHVANAEAVAAAFPELDQG